MRRIAVVGALALGVLALLPMGARAGGVEWLEFRRTYYSPGDRAAGRTRVWFESEEKARIATDGRYVAYLLPESRWFRPPGVHEAAVPLGPVTFSSPDENTAIATLDFTVPDVPAGDWSINVCNQPCTDSMIGDLAGGSIRIAASLEMARILHLEGRLNDARQGARGLYNRTHDLRVEVHALQTENRLLEERLSTLEERLPAVERAAKPEPRSAPGFPPPLGWGVVALTVLFGLMAFRPRRKRPPPAENIEPIDEPEREFLRS